MQELAKKFCTNSQLFVFFSELNLRPYGPNTVYYSKVANTSFAHNFSSEFVEQFQGGRSLLFVPETDCFCKNELVRWDYTRKLSEFILACSLKIVSLKLCSSKCIIYSSQEFLLTSFTKRAATWKIFCPKHTRRKGEISTRETSFLRVSAETKVRCFSLVANGNSLDRFAANTL